MIFPLRLGFAFRYGKGVMCVSNESPVLMIYSAFRRDVIVIVIIIVVLFIWFYYCCFFGCDLIRFVLGLSCELCSFCLLCSSG